MRLGIALLGLLILTGCSAKYDLAGTAWAKPDTLVQQATLDEIECALGHTAFSHSCHKNHKGLHCLRNQHRRVFHSWLYRFHFAFSLFISFLFVIGTRTFAPPQ